MRCNGADSTVDKSLLKTLARMTGSCLLLWYVRLFTVEGGGIDTLLYYQDSC